MSTAVASGTATVEVLYALPDRQYLVELAWQDGMTAQQAVDNSGLPQRFPAIVNSPLVLGIFGVEVLPDQRLKAGDRVEISRPLIADPRAMRREFMADGKVMGGAILPQEKLRNEVPE